MSAVENIRAALDDATNGPWIGAGPSFGAPHAEYLDSVVEDVDHDDAATICRDAEHLAELRAYELTVSNLREQLAQQAPQVPMTDDEIIKYFDKVSTKLGFGLDDILAFTYGALCAQSHHGTKEKP